MKRYTKDDLLGMKFNVGNEKEYEIVQVSPDATCRVAKSNKAYFVSDVLFYLENGDWRPTKSWVIEQFYKRCITQ